MKSINEISQDVTANLPATMPDQSNALALPSRQVPLSQDDIEKLDAVVAEHFGTMREPVYGYAPDRDEKGNIIGQQFDIVAYRQNYAKRTDPPPRLRDAMLRPAKKRHVVYHLTRLAAHKRDTQGEESLAVRLEDIAFDLGEVSEWAVIISCRELRQRPGVWYPESSEIIRVIRDNDGLIRNLFKTSPQSARIAAQKRERTAAPIDRYERDKTTWTKQDWQDHIADARKMVDLAKENPEIFNGDEWLAEVEKRKNEAGLANV